MDKSRASAVVALPIVGFAVVYVGLAIAGWQPSAGWAFQAVIHLGELLVVAALAFARVGGYSRIARTGLAAAAVGQVLLTAAEVIWPGHPDFGNVLFGVAPILTGVGLIAAGAVAVHAGAWTGPGRFLLLMLGLYTLFTLIPAMIVSGGPPALLALVAIGGWDLLWFALAVSVLRRAAS